MVALRSNLRSYDLIKEYSFGIERSTRIKDYQLKGCMEARFQIITLSGRNIAKCAGRPTTDYHGISEQQNISFEKFRVNLFPLAVDGSPQKMPLGGFISAPFNQKIYFLSM